MPSCIVCGGGSIGYPCTCPEPCEQCETLRAELAVARGKPDTLEEQLNAANYVILDTIRQLDDLREKFKNYRDRYGVK